LSPATEFLHDRLDDVFPTRWLNQTARETGLVKRMRTFSPVLLFWVLVLQQGIVLQNNIEALRRKYNEVAKQDALSHAAFYERFTPELVKFLHACVIRALEKLGALGGRRLSDRMAGFKDILIQDSTIVRLNEKMHKLFPATRSRRKDAAGVKLSVVVSVVADGPKTVKLYGERTSESKTMRAGKWMNDRIILIDLGFYKYQMFARIRENGGFFVSRLKDNANPLVTKLTRKVRGASVPVEGERLRDVLPKLRREVLDVEAEVTFRRRKYAGKTSGDEETFRVVAILDEQSGEYHAYITNLTTDQFSAEEIASLYRARWEIELLFRELKTHFSIDKIPTANPRAVEAMLWTGILTLVIHRIVFLTICELQPEKAPFMSHERSAIAFRERGASLMLAEALERRGIAWGSAESLAVVSSGAFSAHREHSTHIKEWRA
jgi:putative transposase